MPNYLYAKTAASPQTSSAKAPSNSNIVLPDDTQSEQVSLPQINQIRFSGNTKISSETLAKNIPLKVKDIANEHIIMDSMVKIAQLYKAKNIKVTITPIIEKASIHSRNIQFDIHEIPMNEKQD